MVNKNSSGLAIW